MPRSKGKASIESPEFHVEKIVDQRTCFLIKWRGFGKAYNTWEPEENLNCATILKNFLKNKTPKTDDLGKHFVKILDDIDLAGTPHYVLQCDSSYRGKSRIFPQEMIEEKYPDRVIPYWKRKAELLEGKLESEEQRRQAVTFAEPVVPPIPEEAISRSDNSRVSIHSFSLFVLLLLASVVFMYPDRAWEMLVSFGEYAAFVLFYVAETILTTVKL